MRVIFEWIVALAQMHRLKADLNAIGFLVC